MNNFKINRGSWQIFRFAFLPLNPKNKISWIKKAVKIKQSNKHTR